MRSLIEIFAMAALAVTLITLLLFPVFFWHAYKCVNQWERSGMKSEYNLAAGCMVQRKDGAWVPASSIRGIE